MAAVDGTSVDASEVTLPTDGDLRRQHVASLPSSPVAGTTVDVSLSSIDSDHVAALSLVDGETREITVLERSVGSVLWGYGSNGTTLQLVAAPVLGGSEGRIIILERDDATGTMTAVALAISDGAIIETREISAGGAAVRESAMGFIDLGVNRNAFFIFSEDGGLTRYDAGTLEADWTIGAADAGLGSFDVAGPIIARAGEFYDSVTGAALNWSSAGIPTVAAGRLLGRSVGSYEVNGRDPYMLWGWDAQTGKRCWEMNVLGEAASTSALWVVTADHTIARVDPQTGAIVETRGATSLITPRIESAADTVVEHGERPETGDFTTVLHIAGGATADIGFQAWSVSGNGDQVVAQAYPSDGEGLLRAFSTVDGSLAWQAIVDDRTLRNDGLMYSVPWSSGGSAQLSIWY